MHGRRGGGLEKLGLPLPDVVEECEPGSGACLCNSLQERSLLTAVYFALRVAVLSQKTNRGPRGNVPVPAARRQQGKWPDFKPFEVSGLSENQR